MNDDIPIEINQAVSEHLELAKLVFDINIAEKKKREVMLRIKQQSGTIKSLYEKCNSVDRLSVREFIRHSNLPLLNKTGYCDSNGIAFCSIFLPKGYATGYVTARRMSEISSFENNNINWSVISADKQPGLTNVDYLFDYYYAAQQFSKRLEIDDPNYLDPNENINWAKKAFEEAVKLPKSNFIYSRSSPPVSHLPALLYKQSFPKTKWYAEFSDPLSTSDKNEKNVFLINSNEILERSGNFYENVELAVYEHADCLIFTNENQFQFMLNNCADARIKCLLQDKRIVKPHPIMDKRFCNVVESDYAMDENRINIAYFGIVYGRRNLEDFLKMSQNRAVSLHIFTPFMYQLEQTIHEIPDNVTVNLSVGNLELLNIAQKMDYLYVEDLLFDGPINPYLPSKLAEYLSTDTRIIARIQQGSALSKTSSHQLIKTTDINDEFVHSLCKAEKRRDI